ncbi:gliding motility-associated C-terminal domain-containing protein [Hymenobacter sp. M29]|uniref:Gliding motility-associated C-terminal domain-containing protein n=1 Tax=Hymenobacter mellowenesis TaxID=3063995 RepID=A0ABT9AIQ4_9BACT|nr:gliding motility-associated C-terminal domain-containing protein [Hymenobacter sp. M29]MDO7849749.1 gliding motility-associated C-terminal domain-containing protein [Hymenobacter sp. M29]
MRSVTLRHLVFSALGLVRLTSPAQAQNPDLPPGTSTAVTAPAGTLVLAMDNTWQSTGGAFNLKAYGLAVHLLNNKVPLRWVMRAGKAKDDADFTALATRVVPRAASLPAAARTFRAGPLLVLPPDTARVRALAAAYNAAHNTGVQLYALQAATAVEVRYVLNQRPVAAILNDGGNAAIHQGYMQLAGIGGNNGGNTLRAQENYVTQTAINLDSQLDCYTFASEPHSTNTAGGVVEALRRFVERGGNFLAECEAVVTYENYANGRFQTSGGVVDADVRDNTARRYPAPDQPFTQFEGEFKASVLGGSVTNWRRAGGSAFHNGGHAQSQLAGSSDEVIEASVSDHYTGRGGLVFYLGGHQYNGTTENDVNGQRMFLNAFLTPATTSQGCNVFADANGNVLAEALRYTLCQGDSVRIQLPAGAQGPETYRWTPATGLSSASSATVWARPASSTAYLVTATSVGGTVHTVPVSVTVLAPTAVSISTDGCRPWVGQEIAFRASAEGSDYRWDFGDGTPATAEPRHQYARPGTYTVQLRGLNAAGCPLAATAPVSISPLLVPNIFTPNADGHNETFRLLGIPAGAARLEVYNRWGAQVYAADRYAHDWDGGALPSGVYYYLVRVADCPTVLKGWVELVR